jgi:5,10-methylenetetrahydromethanopterin reductase
LDASRSESGYVASRAGSSSATVIGSRRRNPLRAPLCGTRKEVQLQLWNLTHSSPDGIQKRAERAERAGWAGLCVVDSQCLAGDSYVALTLAAVATSKLKLGTGVTNSITRHPAVTASAAAALQHYSKGRIDLGIGRGDSALAHLGRAPAGVAHFERYVVALQRYLRGEPVAFSDLDFHERAAPAVAELGLADSPQQSRLLWLPRSDPKVPVEVAATGPRVIGVAARHADRIQFTVGASVERLRWAIDTAKSAAGADTPSFGAYINLVCHPDIETARALVRGGLTTFARFSVMHGQIEGPVDERDREVLDSLHQRYDMKQHTRADSAQAEGMRPDFVDRFAVVGSPERCVERLRELEALGIKKAILVGPTAGADPAAAGEALALFDKEVLPAFAAD